MTTSDPQADESTRARTANAGTVYSAFMNAFDELGRAMAPPESVESHFREARKHALMGLRALIDLRIQKLSRTESKGTRVVVE